MADGGAMIPLDEAFRILDRTLADVRLPGEVLPVREARGRILLADQVSRLDQPPFDQSKVDGYAVAAADEREEYRLVEAVAAGRTPTKPLVPGTTIKVMTGAPTPAGTARVVMQEYAEERGDIVRIFKHDGPENTRLRGEDLRAGDIVARAGATLDAVVIANLIACGISEAAVARAPRVAIFSTGDEIVDDPDRLAPGKIMNSNGPMLAALAQERGFDVLSEASLPDEKEAIIRALRVALERADMVILTGGVSVGECDYVLDALPAVGLTTHFSRLAVKPGKPTVFATARGKAVFALPGNPVAAFLMFHLLVLRAAGVMSGARPQMRTYRLRLARDFWQPRAERLYFIPGRLNEEGEIEPLEFHGSGHLSALSNADGFFLTPIGTDKINAGEEATFIRWTEA